MSLSEAIAKVTDGGGTLTFCRRNAANRLDIKLKCGSVEHARTIDEKSFLTPNGLDALFEYMLLGMKEEMDKATKPAKTTLRKASEELIARGRAE